MTKKTNEQNHQQKETVPSDETLMTTSELMKFLNLSRTKIWAMIQNNGLPAFKFGGDYRFRKSEIIAWMERYRISSGQ
ncbi:MAG: helix-turn-helix domain-containing protein [Planctomycetaceae bacterium]|nr:helix-turn-helix domain-containing protein [Planctomycetaceae bacterium]